MRTRLTVLCVAAYVAQFAATFQKHVTSSLPLGSMGFIPSREGEFDVIEFVHPVHAFLSVWEDDSISGTHTWVDAVTSVDVALWKCVVLSHLLLTTFTWRMFPLYLPFCLCVCTGENKEHWIFHDRGPGLTVGELCDSKKAADMRRSCRADQYCIMVILNSDKASLTFKSVLCPLESVHCDSTASVMCFCCLCLLFNLPSPSCIQNTRVFLNSLQPFAYMRTHLLTSHLHFVCVTVVAVICGHGPSILHSQTLQQPREANQPPSAS
jgi:hypothetical protein